MRIIIIFVTLSILGIFFFQGYWLWNNYKVEKQKTEERINLLLKQAIAEVLAIQVDIIKRDTSASTLHNSIELKLAIDSISRARITPGKRVVSYYRKTTIDPQSPEEEPVVMVKDYYLESYDAIRSASTAIYEMVNNIRPISINTIDHTWNKYLQQAGIFKPHFVNAFYKRNTIIDSSRPKEPEAKNLISTRQISTSINKHYSIQGFVVDANQLVYQKMVASIMLSFFFILITSGGYIYLIWTIRRQKTIAEIKNDFVNNMTHELKTPIAVTYSAIDALQTFKLADQKDKREEYFNLCKHQLKHLSELVEKILSMAVEERKNFHLQKESFLIQPILYQLMKQTEIKTQKEISIRMIDDLGEIPIFADKLHLTQVLVNLLDNAVKYSKEEVTILIHLRTTNGYTEISIQDDGIGISSSQQERIFERFYRVPKGNVHDIKGFGLGLSYVKDIIERHGGSVRVESKEHHGSTFTILIPQPL